MSARTNTFSVMLIAIAFLTAFSYAGYEGAPSNGTAYINILPVNGSAPTNLTMMPDNSTTIAFYVGVSSGYSDTTRINIIGYNALLSNGIGVSVSPSTPRLPPFFGNVIINVTRFAPSRFYRIALNLTGADSSYRNETVISLLVINQSVLNGTAQFTTIPTTSSTTTVNYTITNGTANFTSTIPAQNSTASAQTQRQSATTYIAIVVIIAVVAALVYWRFRPGRRQNK